MGGYAARKHPSLGTLGQLHAKALALEDGAGNRSVLVTMDLLGFSSAFREEIAERCSLRTGIPRERFLFSASHTHSGPALSRVLEIAYELTTEQRMAVQSYSEQLQNRIVDLVSESLRNLEPVKLSFGTAIAGFAVNRRVRTPSGFVIGANRLGPVDHSVPFLVVDDEAGRIRAVVFSYSCHNTTLQGSNYHFHGDYAGVAQQWLEQRYPGAVAFFMAGTAGDANPYPRGTLQLAEEHGRTLARAVDKYLTGPLKPVRGPLAARLEKIFLEFDGPPTRKDFQEKLKSENPYERKHATAFLKLLESGGEVPERYPYPVQVWQFGSDLTLIALAGEVVVDYSIRLKKELAGSADLWISAYCNDISFYVPSRRVLQEGGYEPVDSMIYYGQPGPFVPAVEDQIVGRVEEIVRELNGQGAK